MWRLDSPPLTDQTTISLQVLHLSRGCAACRRQSCTNY